MIKKHAKSTKRPIVYRPNVLDTTWTRHTEPVVSQAGRDIIEIIEQLLMISILGLAAALVVMVGTISQRGSAVTHTHAIARPYNPAILIRPLVGTVRPVGAHHLPRPVAAATTAQPQPEASCSGKTVMNIVAHEDDDLLFINPDISHDLAHHNCVRTVYVTAGDDGRGAAYLRQREAGSRAAYNVMLHGTESWDYQSVALSSGVTVAAANPHENPDVSLIFLRLPDGNLDGQGFPSTGYQSIARLKAGAIGDITSVDGGQTYTSDRLVATLAALMEQYQPVRINAQAQDGTTLVADHSDHLTTGVYTELAAAAYAEQSHHSVMIRNFIGYPIRAMLPNLPADDVAQKSAAFFAYAVDDPGVCTSTAMCAATRSTYGFYLQRQYLGVGQ